VGKIVAAVATSADGFIARPDGDVGWLDRPQPKGRYGMPAFLRSIDTVVMGRKTYDIALEFGHAFDSKTKTYVFTHRRAKGAEGVEFVRGPVGPFARKALRGRSRGGKNAWLMGGADLIGAFLDAGELDELVVYVVPILIGAGIPLVKRRRRSAELELLSSRAFPDGVVRIAYRVRRPAAT